MRPLLFCLPGSLLLVTVLLWPAGAGGPSAAPVTGASDPMEGLPDEFALRDEVGFDRLGEPRPGDWLERFEERGQTFTEYLASRPVRAAGRRKTLAFLPVGGFEAHEASVAAATFEFAGLWFDLDVRVLDPVGPPGEKWTRERDFGRPGGPEIQIHTDWFLRRLLPPRLPDDAVMLSAITAMDLYPEAGWNYVFGFASFSQRIAVYSIRRHFAEFRGGRPDGASRIQALRRSLKLVTHELGHTFGLAHCTAFLCNMNGSLSLAESDRQPLFLCPVCLAKLRWNRGFDIVARYRRLRRFHEEHGLMAEAEWTAARLERIESAR